LWTSIGRMRRMQSRRKRNSRVLILSGFPKERLGNFNHSTDAFSEH
jgi:hypothetical protein